jgi:hypothetical protein
VIEKTFSLRSGSAAPTIVITGEPPQLANLATRASVGGVAGPLILGFVIEGADATVTKRVLVRGVGPALAGFGLTGVLARPTLTLFHDGQPIATNTAWSTAANAADIAAATPLAGAFALAPGSADSALLLRLAPGAYTAQITAADGGSGLALAEAYEAESGGNRFANLSTRAFVGTGAAVAIPGLVVTGPSARTFLIRGVGPGLADFGVTGTLARPSLVLMRGATSVQANDRWETAPDPAALAAVAQKVAAFPLRAGSADAAMLVTLEPAAYTILISGANGGTGNCLVEIYQATP